MRKSKVVLAGAGKIGEAIVALLAQSGDYEVTVVEQDGERLRAFAGEGLRTHTCSLGEPGELVPVLKGQDAVISACPYHLTPLVARAAREAGVHYFDLTEDVESTRVVKRLAEGAASAFVPQCGLAPGFISIAAHDATRGFDSLRDVRMRVGALPIYPSNALKYNLTWSTEGLINEYCNPCEAIVDGAVREVAALEGMEEFSLDGVAYEAFNTSGGLGTLCETLAGRVREPRLQDGALSRPPRDREDRCVRDLRLARHREVLKDVFEAAIPMTTQDLVIVFVTVTRPQARAACVQETFVRKIYSKRVGGKHLSAIQLTTAAGICAMVDLQREGRLPARGFVRQEEVPLADFLANRFGRHYAEGASAHAAGGHGPAGARIAA